MARTYRPSDRRGAIFGRDADILHLVTRAKRKGLTAVVAKPLMGKTFLLTHVAWLLSEDNYLVGFVESVGQGADLMLRVVEDLYTFWLHQASYGQQAKHIWLRHKDKLPISVAKAVGAIFDALSKTVGLEAVGKLVTNSLEVLVSGVEDQRTGGLTLPKLDYDKARELVNFCAAVSEKPIIMFLDAWEKSSVAVESTILDAFLTHLDDWPSCHVFLGLRPNELTLEKLKSFERESPEANIYKLELMHPENVTKTYLLATYIKDQLPNLRDVTNDQLLELAGGYPGVIDRWISNNNRNEMRTFADLQRVANEAQQRRYGEFDALLSGLSNDERKLAIRLAFFLRLDRENWEFYKDVLLDGLNHELLFALQQKNVLEDEYAYGHDTRHLEARRWFLREQKYRPQSQYETTALIFRLARRVDNSDPLVRPFVEALVWFAFLADELQLDKVSRSLGVAAMSLFPDINVDANLLLSTGRSAIQQEPRVAPLIAMSLLKGQFSAKAENDLQLRDALLVELRQLQQAWPQDHVIRESLAKGLFNTLLDAKVEDDLQLRDALLVELRQLQQAWPQDHVIRESLARGLFNTLNDAKAENDLQLRDALLVELRRLQQAWPQDPAVRENLAMGLFSTLNDAKAKDALRLRDALLVELRQLQQAWPQDPAVRENLSKGLFNTLHNAKAEDDLQLRDALLVELRQLQQAWPHDPVLRVFIGERG